MYPGCTQKPGRETPAMKLSPSSIAAWRCRPASDDKIFFDDELPGFGLRLRRSGDRSWWVQYAIAGRTRKLRLGSVAELDISKARSTAKDVLARVRLGGDPAHEKRAGRVLAGETVGALLPAFLERQRARLKPRSYLEVERHLNVHCKPLHPLAITALDRRTVATRLGQIAKTTGPADSQPGPQPACRHSSRGAHAKAISTPTLRPTPTRRLRTAGAIAC